MKKLLYTIAISLAAIGCTKSEIIENTPTSGEISFTAGVATRVSADDDCAWAATSEDNYPDMVGIFTSEVDYTNDDTYAASTEKNLKFTISDASGSMTNSSGVGLYPLDEGTRSYYAYHPYDSALTSTTIAIDCTKQEDLEPLLWAKTEDSNSNEVTLSFAHQYAKVIFSLTSGGGESTSLTNATAWFTGANSKGNFDIVSGEFEITATDKITLVIDPDQNDTTKATITAYLPPMADNNDTDDTDTSVKSNVNLWVNDGDNTFIYFFTAEKWESGNVYEYEITVGEEEEVVIEEEEA